MVSSTGSPTLDEEKTLPQHGNKDEALDDSAGHDVQIGRANETVGGEDILGLQDLDPALNMKMHLVNNVRPHTATLLSSAANNARRDVVFPDVMTCDFPPV